MIAGGFIAGAALEAVLAPLAGRFSDRVGRRTALRRRARDLRRGDGRDRRWRRRSGAVLAALILTSLGAGLCFAPALTLLSDVAESSGLHQGFAAGLSNMAWAAGQVVGGIGGGGVASLTGNAAAEHRDRRRSCCSPSLYAFRALAPPASAAPAAGGLGSARWRR